MKCKYCGKDLNKDCINIDYIELDVPDLLETFLKEPKKIKVFKKFLASHNWYYATDYEEQDSYVIKLNKKEIIKNKFSCQYKKIVYKIISKDIEFYLPYQETYKDRKDRGFGQGNEVINIKEVNNVKKNS